MSNYSVEKLTVDPVFDLELLMNISQETRIGGDTMNALSDAWDDWVAFAHADKITIGDDSFLLAWLGEEVEDFVDSKWEESPSEAFMFNALAQVMCMGIVHSLLPEVEEVGCAASPEITDDLVDALESIGVSYLTIGEPGLTRKYAVVTYFPFKGGCNVCSMQKQCPKGSDSTRCATGDGPTSIVLPGFDAPFGKLEQ